MLNLNFEQINPFVRYAQFLKITSNKQYINIASYDYRYFFCYGGHGEIVVDGVSYEMKIGSAILWRPGVKYSLQLVSGSDCLELMGVNFDFTQNKKTLNTPIAPEKCRSFKNSKIIEEVNFTDFNELNSTVHLTSVPFLHNPTHNLVSEYISKKNFYKVRTSGQLKSILSLLARFTVNEKSANKTEFLVDQIIQFIHANYSEEINNQMLGEHFGYHPNHLNRIMVKHTGMSIHKYLMSCRIDAATELVIASDLRTAEIAEAVGFKDSSHFLKYFKKFTGKNTKDFRK